MDVNEFMYYAGNALPYPDPTPELLAYQAAEAKKWSLVFAPGLLATTIGGIWLLRRMSRQLGAIRCINSDIAIARYGLSFQ
jgi:hypothetical protein